MAKIRPFFLIVPENFVHHTPAENFTCVFTNNLTSSDDDNTISIAFGRRQKKIVVILGGVHYDTGLGWGGGLGPDHNFW